MRQAALLPLFAAILLWGAIYNRFPLVYSDTGTYLNSTLTQEIPVDRPIFYGLFLRAAQALSASLWWPALAQTLILSALLLLLIRRARPDAKAGQVAALAALLAAATGLPWVCGELMPDVFAGCLAISAYLLAFPGPESKSEKTFLAIVFAGSLLVHYSHILIAALCLIALSADLRVRRNLLLPAGLLAAALAVSPAVNALYGGQASFSNSHVFLMSRLIEHRIVDRLLEEHCGERNYALCRYKDEVKAMSGGAYPWSDTMKKLGGWDSSASVTWPIIVDATLYYPGANLISVVGDTARQFFFFSTGEGVASNDPSRYVYRVIRDGYPGSFEAFSRSRQQRGLLPRVLGPLSAFHRAVGFLAMAAAAALLLGFPSRGRPEGRSLLGFLLLFCAANAFVCGNFSIVSGRFQGRVIWLLVLAVALAASWTPAAEQAPRPEGRLAWKPVAAGLSAGCLASVLAAVWISGSYVPTGPSPYVPKPVLTWPRPYRIVRRTPLSALRSRGMVPGDQMQISLASGGEFIGTVTAAGADAITLEAPWEMVRWGVGGSSPR